MSTALSELIAAVESFLVELDAAKDRDECGECPPTVETEKRLRAALENVKEP